MSNRLEDFIRDNREEFDSEEPRPQLWRKMRSELEDGDRRNDKVFHLSFLRWTAAAAILIMVAGMFYYMNRQAEPARFAKTNEQPTSDEYKELNQINPDYAKEVYHFTQLIELKQNELKQIEKEHPELYNQFVKDIHKLDSSYQALRAELPANPDPETLLEAMLQNLRLQADLLNEQLIIIKQIKQNKQTSHEKDTRSA
jgi:hypothetical protein